MDFHSIISGLVQASNVDLKENGMNILSKITSDPPIQVLIYSRFIIDSITTREFQDCNLDSSPLYINHDLNCFLGLISVNDASPSA